MAVVGILGVVASCLGPAIDIGKLITAPVRRQCSYLCCLGSNIKTLEDEAKILDIATKDLQERVDADTNNAQIILSTVDTWLKDSVKVKTETKEILDEAPDVGSGCSKLGKRYSLSKKAKKAAIAVKLLVEKCKFTEIARPPPIAACAPVQSGTTTYEFESRRGIEEEIVKGLGDKNVNKIGICGMGGLGKTTMAKKIMNRALTEGLFDEVVMAVVSQPVDKLNIQQQIAKPLGLEFKDDNVLNSRANLLRGRLKGRKRILLVLDDVWERLDMEELGIPCEDGCKVLITSRDNHIFIQMGVKKVGNLNILDDKEAWLLFRGNAGTCVEDSVLKSTAKDVMRECKGLPLALEIVGLALKDKTDISKWEDALGQLRRSNPADIPRIIQKVYNHLKLSYDHLDSENTKTMFLLCCLFPEDCDIPMEHLNYFAVGLHVFEDLGDLKEVRGRTRSLIDILKSRGLLLDGSNKDHVRMHDVVRDVSIFIASTDRRIKCKDCTWISSHVHGGTRLNNVPKLKLLLMNDKAEEEQEMDNLIEGSTELNVLFIERYFLLKSLPVIVSLTALVLSNCESLESIAVVGELVSLEILICRDCGLIEELPEQAKGLKRLKLLEIADCPELGRVAAGVISSMVALEELKIVGSFDDWRGGEIYTEEAAGLREIEALKKLRCLDIEVSNIALVAQPLRLLSPDLLVQFGVQFGERNCEFSLGRGNERSMTLYFRDEHIEWGVLQLTIIFLTRIEFLLASGTHDQDFSLNLASAQGIRKLFLINFKNKKNIASAAAAFPLLEFLCLKGMYKLEEIWDDDAPIPSNSFTNLKYLELLDLRVLKRMGKIVLSTANDFFLQLKTIMIWHCYEMEHLLVTVPNEEEQDDECGITLSFPKLKKFVLDDVPKLRSMICGRGIESIQFPLLVELRIESCSSWIKWLGSRDDDDDDHYKDDQSLHLFCLPKVSFGKLQILGLADNTKIKNVWCDKVPMDFFTGLVELKLFYYTKTRRLFSSSSKIPQNLVNLQKLTIGRCKEMVKVIEDEEEACDDDTTKHNTTPLFPSLQKIKLLGLPKLESFCEQRCALELASLKFIDIRRCDEMKSFNAVTPALQAITINGEELESGDDLNAVLLHQQYLRKTKKEREEEENEIIPC